ncbi:hypothetical protein KKG22_00855 [Patescibacteria group bacterium]|nr:hypothetical protein [Patescibacteria group bacterium]MBU1721984.1 hypothetical protein [Patescibacteria group bacterium]MBU1901267.1 hypothetical protein [Patescibacteria group bacterium]
MNLRQYLTIMILATILCWAAFVVVLVNVDPFQDAGLGLLFFYVSLFFSIVGTGSLVSFALSLAFTKKEIPVFRHVRRTFIIGVFVSFALSILLYLQAREALTLWNMLLLFSIVCFLILFRISTRSYSKDV